jgi:hypothetical protein
MKLTEHRDGEAKGRGIFFSQYGIKKERRKSAYTKK